MQDSESQARSAQSGYAGPIAADLLGMNTASKSRIHPPVREPMTDVETLVHNAFDSRTSEPLTTEQRALEAIGTLICRELSNRHSSIMDLRAQLASAEARIDCEQATNSAVQHELRTAYLKSARYESLLCDVREVLGCECSFAEIPNAVRDRVITYDAQPGDSCVAVAGTGFGKWNCDELHADSGTMCLGDTKISDTCVSIGELNNTGTIAVPGENVDD